MYKKQPCDDANEDMKINGRRTKTLLYLSRIFCFTGVALLWRRIYFFLRFVWLANCTAGTLWSIYDSTRTSLPRKDDSVFELTEMKMFHLFISSLQIIRMTIRPRHNSWGVMSAITRRISPLGQNRDKTRLQMRDTVHREDTGLWVRQAERLTSSVW